MLTYAAEPGGHLQWNEADLNDFIQTAAAPDVARSNVETLFKRVRDTFEGSNGFDAGWVRNLGSILRAHPDVGTVLADEFHVVADGLATPASLMVLSTVQEVLSRFLPDLVQYLDLQGLSERAGAGIQAGMSARLGQVVVVAQKRR